MSRLDGLAPSSATLPSDKTRDPTQTENKTAIASSLAMSGPTDLSESAQDVKMEHDGSVQVRIPIGELSVKQEPLESSSVPAASSPLAKMEEVQSQNIKTEPAQSDAQPNAPSSTTILPTTENERPSPKPVPKKAPANKAAPSRKRKAEQVSQNGTPVPQRSSVPASAKSTPKASLAKDARARSSGDGENDEGDEDDEDEGEGGTFCICRGPDDHTWMIGCDGECEDWFHGRCVNMKQEDADLVDKYICTIRHFSTSNATPY